MVACQIRPNNFDGKTFSFEIQFFVPKQNFHTLVFILIFHAMACIKIL